MPVKIDKELHIQLQCNGFMALLPPTVSSRGKCLVSKIQNVVEFAFIYGKQYIRKCPDQ